MCQHCLYPEIQGVPESNCFMLRRASTCQGHAVAYLIMAFMRPRPSLHGTVAMDCHTLVDDVPS